MAEYQYLTSRGVIVADTSETRAQVEAEFKAVFGQGLVTEPSSPAGVLITRITEERDALARNNAELANQINPDYAGGIFLDAIWRLTGGQRNAESKSMIYGVVLAGVPMTIVPVGGLARAATGDIFELAAAVQIGAAGTTTGTFRALEYGAIQVPAHGLDTVASSVLGWETVDNPGAAIPGREEERDSAARRRRRQTLALQTTSVNEAVVSRLYAIPEVRSLYYLENYTDTTQVIDGVTLKKYSMWACVEGGSDEAIAKALFETKTIGGGYNGAISVSVQDPTNGRPYPVEFDRPEDVALLIRVTCGQSALDLQTLVPQLVMNYVDGLLEGDVSFVVGSDVSPWELSGAINQQEPSIRVKRVELSLVGSGAWSTDVYAIAPNQIARTQLSSITVVLP